jgi:hypothetical protein
MIQDVAVGNSLERPAQTLHSESVPWSSPQTELLERPPEKKRERRTEHQRRY